jgi:ribonucleoside-diphosphate reductase beta chain
LSQDLNDWNNKLNDERYFVKHCFFCSFWRNCKWKTENFVNEVQYAETKFFYGFQIMMENIHSEIFTIDRYLCKRRSWKDKLFNALVL